MKRVVKIVLIFSTSLFFMFYLPVFVFGQDSGKGNPSKQQCFRLFGPQEFFYGTMGQRETAEHTYILKNDCNELIEIEDVKSSCGCTAAVLSEKLIQPGKEARINVKFTPIRGSRGKITKTVSVFLKGKTEPHIVLRFSAEIKAEIETDTKLIALTDAVTGEKSVAKVKVRNPGSDMVVVTASLASMTSYHAKDSLGIEYTQGYVVKNVTVSPETMVIQPGEAVDVIVAFTPEKKGKIFGTLKLEAKTSEIMVEIVADVGEKGENALQEKTQDKEIREPGF